MFPAGRHDIHLEDETVDDPAILVEALIRRAMDQARARDAGEFGALDEDHIADGDILDLLLVVDDALVVPAVLQLPKVDVPKIET